MTFANLRKVTVNKLIKFDTLIGLACTQSEAPKSSVNVQKSQNDLIDDLIIVTEVYAVCRNMILLKVRPKVL